MDFQPIRGTKDIFGEDMALHNKVIDVARFLSKTFCYTELVTPIFEKSEVFFRTLGDVSDVVTKETYTFIDRDGSSITLRPEFTAGVVRAFISNGMTQKLPAKFFSFGPIFRHERPQRGRFRQFNQINFEYFGGVGAGPEIEVIALAEQILNRLGIRQEITLELNTLGDKDSRIKYRNSLFEYFSKYKNALSADSQHRLDKNPLRILDSKDEQDKKISLEAPSIFDHLNSESITHYESVLQGLNNLGIKYIQNNRLVRGLDYYTNTVFEFTTQRLGSQGTVLGGGGYNGLIELMGGPSMPGVGFAAGVERLAELMKEISGVLQSSSPIYLITIGDKANSHGQALINSIRQEGYCVEIDYHNNTAKKFKRANQLQAKYCLILGELEVEKGIIKIKDMLTSDEKEIKLNELFIELQNMNKG